MSLTLFFNLNYSKQIDSIKLCWYLLGIYFSLIRVITCLAWKPSNLSSTSKITRRRRSMNVSSVTSLPKSPIPAMDLVTRTFASNVWRLSKVTRTSVLFAAPSLLNSQKEHRLLLSFVVLSSLNAKFPFNLLLHSMITATSASFYLRAGRKRSSTFSISNATKVMIFSSLTKKTCWTYTAWVFMQP